ncbi:MAG: hypothetical protein KatS3mg059_0696 [Thermomicrobiales bacterium]|nr:MAG: hypothetical protein KatS3mg059_0696 [Thermomicrobiales bacterium]
MDWGADGGGRRFRIEHRIGDETRPLGEIEGEPPHPTALDAWASYVRRRGGTGQLVLVDAETGEDLACQDLERRAVWRLRSGARYPHRTVEVVAARRALAALRTGRNVHSPREASESGGFPDSGTFQHRGGARDDNAPHRE